MPLATFVPAIATVAGGFLASKGSKNAAQTQVDGQREASAISERQYNQTRTDQLAQLAQQRTDQAPYREAGYGALSQLVGGMAQGGEFNRQFSMDDIMRNQDPGYDFRLQQGEQGITRAATAGGSRYSGATLKALSRFNSGLASQEAGAAYGRYSGGLSDRFNRLSSLAGTGQTATNNTGQAGQNAYGNIMNAGQNNANNMGNSAANAASARASGYVGSANAINGTLGSMVNSYQQQQLLGSMSRPPSQTGEIANWQNWGA